MELYERPNAPVDERVDDLLGRLSLKEKTGQLLYANARNLGLPKVRALGDGEDSQALSSWFDRELGNVFLTADFGGSTARDQATTINRLQARATQASRWGIPLLVHTESLHGLLSHGGTMFPQAIGLGCMWDANLVTEIFAAVAREGRLRGLHMTYAPVLDIGTDPRWGRIQETYGEDPYLTSRYAEAVVAGYQQANPDDARMIATAKHFAGYGQGRFVST